MAGRVQAARKFINSPVSGTRKEHLAMAAVTGVSIGSVNSTINQHYVQKSKNAYYRRKLRTGKIIRVEKAVNHGLGINQTKRGGGK